MKMKIENIFGGRKLLAAMFVAMLAMVCIGGMVAVSDNETEVSAAESGNIATVADYTGVITGNITAEHNVLAGFLPNSNETAKIEDIDDYATFGITPADNYKVISVMYVEDGVNGVKVPLSQSGNEWTLAAGSATAGTATLWITSVMTAATFEKVSGTLNADKIVAGKNYVIEDAATIPAGVTITVADGNTLVVGAGASLEIKGTLIVKDYIGTNSTVVTPAFVIDESSPAARNMVALVNNGQITHTSIGLKENGDIDPAKSIESSVKATGITGQNQGVIINTVGFNDFDTEGKTVDKEQNMIEFSFMNASSGAVSTILTTGSISVYGNIQSTDAITFNKGTSFTVGQSVEGAPASIFIIGTAKNDDLIFADKTAMFTVVDAKVNTNSVTPSVNNITTKGAVSITGNSILCGTGTLTLREFDASFTAGEGVILGLTGGIIVNATDSTIGSPVTEDIGQIIFGAYASDVGAPGDYSVVAGANGFSVKAVKADGTLDEGTYNDLLKQNNTQITGYVVDHVNPKADGTSDAVGTIDFEGDVTASIASPSQISNTLFLKSDMPFGSNISVTFVESVTVDSEVEITLSARVNSKVKDATLTTSNANANYGTLVWGIIDALGNNETSTVINNATAGITVYGNGSISSLKAIADDIVSVYYVVGTTYYYTSFAEAFGADAPSADDNEFTLKAAMVVEDGEYTMAAGTTVKGSFALTFENNAMLTVISDDTAFTAPGVATWVDDSINAQIYAGAIKAMANAPVGTNVNIGTTDVTIDDNVVLKEGVRVTVNDSGNFVINNGVTLTVIGDVVISDTVAATGNLEVNGKLVVDGGNITMGNTSSGVIFTGPTGEITVASGAIDGTNGTIAKINAAYDNAADKYTNVADAIENAADFTMYGTVNGGDITIPMGLELTVDANAKFTASITLTENTGTVASEVIIGGSFNGTIIMSNNNQVEIVATAAATGTYIGSIVFAGNTITMSDAQMTKAAGSQLQFKSVKAVGETAASIEIIALSGAEELIGSYAFDGKFTSGGLEVGATGVVKIQNGTFESDLDFTAAGGKVFIGTGATSIGADGVVYKGIVDFTVAGLLVVYPNANMIDANITAATKNTAFYVEDTLYMTEYADANIGYDLSAPVIDGYKFAGWKNVAGELVKTTDNVGTFDKIYADVTEVTFAVTLGAVTGADYVIDGIAYSAGSVAYLTAGTHTVSLNAKAGYDVSKATISAAAGGKVTVTGSSLTVAGEGVIGATGVTEKGTGMSITDILMIVLVVVVVILAIVIVMRLMRS